MIDYSETLGSPENLIRPDFEVLDAMVNAEEQPTTADLLQRLVSHDDIQNFVTATTPPLDPNQKKLWARHHGTENASVDSASYGRAVARSLFRQKTQEAMLSALGAAQNTQELRQKLDVMVKLVDITSDDIHLLDYGVFFDGLTLFASTRPDQTAEALELYEEMFKYTRYQRIQPPKAKLTPEGRISRAIITECRKNLGVNADDFDEKVVGDYFDHPLVPEQQIAFDILMAANQNKLTVDNLSQQGRRLGLIEPPGRYQAFRCFNNTYEQIKTGNPQIIVKNPDEIKGADAWFDTAMTLAGNYIKYVSTHLNYAEKEPVPTVGRWLADLCRGQKQCHKLIELANKAAFRGERPELTAPDTVSDLAEAYDRVMEFVLTRTQQLNQPKRQLLEEVAKAGHNMIVLGQEAKAREHALDIPRKTGQVAIQGATPSDPN